MNNFQLRQILLEIQSNLRCMHCGKSYMPENIHLRGSFKNMYLFQLACEDHAAYATITVIGQQRSDNESTLTDDDCINFHRELRSFSGDFQSVLSHQ